MPEGQNADCAARWIEAMRRGDYVGAWAISDAVLAARDPGSKNDPEQPYHRRWVWNGTDPAGRDVLVRCYHGLGDTLQFARFLPLLATIARHVTVEAPPALIALLEASDLGVQYVPFEPAQPQPPSPCDIEIMELSHVLRVGPDSVPPPYLRNPRRDKTLVHDEAPIAGLCWRVGAWDHERSLPLCVVLPYLPPDWRIARLQPDLRADEDGLCPFTNDDTSLATILDTAALIGSTKLIVTVDTMVAHLAGALEHPAIVLLKYDADWRWESGSRCGWYPRTRLFRQPRSGDWDGALSQLSSALARRAED
jgi:hypothetical protein